MKVKQKEVTLEAIQWTGQNKVAMDDFFQESEQKPTVILTQPVLIHTEAGTLRVDVKDTVVKVGDDTFIKLSQDTLDELFTVVDDEPAPAPVPGAKNAGPVRAGGKATGK